MPGNARDASNSGPLAFFSLRLQHLYRGLARVKGSRLSPQLVVGQFVGRRVKQDGQDETGYRKSSDYLFFYILLILSIPVNFFLCLTLTHYSPFALLARRFEKLLSSSGLLSDETLQERS
jgi:hypothetical protein